MVYPPVISSMARWKIRKKNIVNDDSCLTQTSSSGSDVPLPANVWKPGGKRGILGILMVLMVYVPSFSINSVVLREACPQQQLLVGFSPWQGMEKWCGSNFTRQKKGRRAPRTRSFAWFQISPTIRFMVEMSIKQNTGRTKHIFI